MLVGGREIDGDGLVLAVGLHPRDGSVIDVKADICGHHCLGYSEAEWIERLDALAAHFGLAPLPVARAFERGARVSYVGFGLDAGAARGSTFTSGHRRERGAAGIPRSRPPGGVRA